MIPQALKVYCKAGQVIDNARILKYEPFYRKIVRDFLPGLCLSEASMAYDDLLNQLRYEAFMALKNGFDPVKAMQSTIADPEKREKQLEKKRNDPAQALIQAEKNIVYGRLVNYMRRVRWKYHPDQRGGRSMSLDAILCSAALDSDGAEMAGFFSVHDKVTVNAAQVDLDRHDLLKALEKGQDVKSLFMSLSDERREDLLEVLQGNTIHIESADWDELASPKIVEDMYEVGEMALAE